MQEALDSLTKENVRMRADVDYLQHQLDLAVQQADTAQSTVSQNPRSTIHVRQCLKQTIHIHVCASFELGCDGASQALWGWLTRLKAQSARSH